MGPFHAIGEDRTSDLWRMKGIVTFNGHEIKESVVQFTILRKGLGVPKHYANLIKNPATSKNQEEDSLVSDFAFTIVTEEFDRISQHAVKWHEIKITETFDWQIGLDIMQSMHLVLQKAQTVNNEFKYRIGF